MSEISQKKLDRLKAAAHRGLSHAHAGVKATVLPIAAGAASAAVMDKAFDSMPDFVKNNWWGRGVTIGVIGHFVGVKKNRRAGDALLGAAGAQLYNDYQKKQSSSAPAKGVDYDAAALIGGMQQAAAQMNQAAAQMGPMFANASAVLGGMSNLSQTDAGATVGDDFSPADVGDGDDAGDWGDSF